MNKPMRYVLGNIFYGLFVATLWVGGRILGALYWIMEQL